MGVTPMTSVKSTTMSMSDRRQQNNQNPSEDDSLAVSEACNVVSITKVDNPNKTIPLGEILKNHGSRSAVECKDDQGRGGYNIIRDKRPHSNYFKVHTLQDKSSAM